MDMKFSHFQQVLILPILILAISCISISSEIGRNYKRLPLSHTEIRNDAQSSKTNITQDNQPSEKLDGQIHGRKLRNYVKIPQSNRLDSGVEFVNKTTLNMWCSLPKNSNEKIKECYINSPDGNRYLKTDKSLKTFKENDNTSEWIPSVDLNIIIIMPKDNKQCKVVINEVKDKDIGKWSCKTILSETNQFQESVLTVPTREETQNSFLPVRDVRLPTSIAPEKYNVYLTPFIIKDNYTIEGHVDIFVKVSEPTFTITLHIRDILIYENLVHVEDREVVGHGYDDKREFYIIHVHKELTVDHKFKVSISFLANLNDDLSGFYRSSYYDSETNETKYLAVSDFEAPDARQALPCFDEPDKKAIFQVNLGRTKDMSSISNMPQLLNGVPMDDNDEYVWDVYEDSVKMSTYLLAFVVSEFEFRASELTPNNVRFRIWSRKDAIDQTIYASDIGPKILEYYESYFGVPYPLPKQDMIAIPDFSAGAMENWGLITYRETALLYEEGVTSSQGKERIRTVIAHELAHQWFGNLVTMKWWTDLWLNEGFASYVEYLGAEHVAPSSGIMDRFAIREIQRTFPYDSLQTSHPISVDVQHPNEIAHIFDTISYGKGASIIRMMANFLGIQTFNQGITKYLRKYEYGNAMQDDLWQSLTDVAVKEKTLHPDLKVKEIMDTWTLQMGYPVVKVERDYDSSEIKLTQERFLMFRDVTIRDDNLYRWWIPISCTYSDAENPRTKTEFWMSPKDSYHITSEYCNTPTDSALIINVEQTGYYRVNYDENNWNLIISDLNRNMSSIHRSNRAQLIDDAMNLARAGYLKYEISLQLIDYLERETEFIPWKSGLSNFRFIRKMLSRTGAYGYYKKYIKAKVEPILNKLNKGKLLNGDVMNELLLVELVKEACEIDSEYCGEKLVEARDSLDNIKHFNRHQTSDTFLEDGDTTQPLLKQISLCKSVWEGDEERWDEVWKMYTESSNVSMKRRILKALGCSRHIWILKRYLEMSIDSKSGIRKQDGTTVIASVAKNSIGRDLTWNWLRNDWERISSYYDPKSSKTISRVINTLTNDFNTPLKLKELEKFYEDHETELGGATKSILSSIQNVKANAKWMKENYDKISKWLQTKIEMI